MKYKKFDLQEFGMSLRDKVSVYFLMLDNNFQLGIKYKK